MKLLNITAQNFLSYSYFTQELDQSGLVLIHGKMGCGKSSRIVDSITWAIWGKTPRGYSGDDVVHNKKNKDCFVKLVLFDETVNVYYCIERYRKHKILDNKVIFRVNSENDFPDIQDKDVDITSFSNPDTQKSINDLIGVDFTTFTNSIMFSQKTSKGDKRFTEMTESELLKVFEDILALSIYDEAREKANQQKLEIDKELNTLISDRNSEQGKIELTKKYITNTNYKIGELAIKLNKIKDSENNLSLLETQKDSINRQIDSLQKDKDDLTLTESFLRERINEKSQLNIHFSNEIGNIDQDISQTERNIRTLILEKTKIESQLNDKNKLLGKPCPICKQMITNDVLGEDLSCLKNKKLELIDDIDNKEKHKELLKNEKQAKKDELQPKIIYLDNEIEGLKHRIEKEKNRLKKEDLLLKNLDNVNKEIEKIKIDSGLESIEAEINSSKCIVQDYKDTIIELEKSISLYNKGISDLEKSKKYYEYWYSGFGPTGIKPYLLDGIIPSINNNLDYYSGLLTNGNAAIAFNTTKQLKSKETRNKLNLSVSFLDGAHSSDGASGGEKRIVDVIISLAIRKFIADNSNKNFNILVGDEPFLGMGEDDAETIVKLLKGLNNESIPSIFIISHELTLTSWFNKVIEIEKINGYSKEGN